MWLLDANMNVHLAGVLAEFGFPCNTAASRGWKDLSNGDLASTAAAAGFHCLLTRDQLLGESASRVLRSFPEFAVVVVDLPQRRWQQYRKQFVAAWAARPIQPVPGRLIHWPSP
ncbi:MAG: hypothetical protein ABSH05_15300 [Bryobacteraceae bacterium]|jgi:hypothetical protein